MEPLRLAWLNSPRALHEPKRGTRYAPCLMSFGNFEKRFEQEGGWEITGSRLDGKETTMRNIVKLVLPLASLALPLAAVSYGVGNLMKGAADILGPSMDNEGATALGTVEKYEEREVTRMADEMETLRSRPDPNAPKIQEEDRRMYSKKNGSASSTDTSTNTSRAGQEDEGL